ncbi:hypothetical protein OIDMADRAFT_19603 [Oidiodendron maius Zn]|uniref:Uncharacterized protein n=1 Tax=Oidiodendron maius (strain Zn) TaxID=913774 RepID=A0A0C3HBX3_OIDMZ|nr:hypothetical protein OIDMADRAFT_19603 [Oidiodendron maius Zn]
METSNVHTSKPPVQPNLEQKAIPPVSPNTQQQRQPWRAVWPQPLPEGRPMQYYGFKKGERMNVPGNAGDFFAHGNWTVEFETT